MEDGAVSFECNEKYILGYAALMLLAMQNS